MVRPSPALLPLAALLLVPAARALAAEPPAPGPGAADPVAERFAAASDALDRERRTPEGLSDLVALAGLEDELSDLGRLAAVYERTAGDAAAWPEVRALA